MECFINPDQIILNKVAAFDLDGTLIKTKSGRRFPKDKDDWIIIDETIKPILRGIYDNGYTIIVFTNQKNLEKRMKITDFKEKCMNIQKELDIPIIFYVSLKNNYMRKPFPGMFEYHTKQHPIVKAFYVGDAWSKTECFSDSDLCFAKNCKIPFYKASEFFGDNTVKIIDMEKPSLSADEDFVTNQIKLSTFIADKKYIFIVGAPASGKTTFCEKYLSNYMRLSKDDYKTPARYRNIILENLDNKIVFDNTNSTDTSRAKILSYLSKVENIGYIVRNIPKKEAFYLNQYRHFITWGKVKLLPNVAIYAHYKRLVLPTGPNVFTINYSWISGLKEFYC